MAFPTIYIDTGGAATNSGSSDSNSATHSSVINSVTASVSTVTVTLSGAVDLSAVPTDGSATIYINEATNANQKVFKITAVNDGADTVTVDIAITGTITASAWAIGGRFLISSGNFDTDLADAVEDAWTIQFNNSPASHSGSDFITMRNSGGTDGLIKFIGLAGAKRVLTVTDTNQVVEVANNAIQYVFENIEFVQQGASGNISAGSGVQGGKYYDCKFSDAGGDAFGQNPGPALHLCEITGVGGDAMDVSGQTLMVMFGCYIHDIGGVAYRQSQNHGDCVFLFNIIDTCAEGGFLYTDTTVNTPYTGTTYFNNTVYGCGGSGFETSDTTAGYAGIFANNIFSENGDAAGEYNVEWDGWTEKDPTQGWNCFFHSGGGGGANLLTYTVNSTEITTDPSFVDAAGGDFRLNSGSPCKATGFPGQFLGGSLGYLDMGAVQRVEPTSGTTAKLFSSTLHPIGQGV